MESARVVLSQNGEIAVVGVRSGAIELAVKSDRMRRIVQHAQRRQRRIDMGLKEAFGQTEVNRKSPMELFAQALHRHEIADKDGAKVGQIRPLIHRMERFAGEDVRIVGGKIAPDVERFFCISRAVRIEFFVPDRNVTVIAQRVLDRNALFDVDRQLEKLPRCREQPCDGGVGDAVLGNVKEADIAAGSPYCDRNFP